MPKRFQTIGMAGHIDHGKTTLTKALTNIETDRLKEEKERAISIELGYARLELDAKSQVSIIDVPGHEKFIRQMIAGVAGIDLVLLVVAADEGVMPQTVEHLDILQLLGIHQGLIVVTKMDQVEEDMKEFIEADINDQIEGTFLEGTEFLFVDSVSEKGIPELKQKITERLADIPVKDVKGAFRLPIDQVFTVHGQGTVVRGTVYEGRVKEADILELLPQKQKVRARQLQVHHEPQKEGSAGQRVAINLGGVSKQDIQRGDVLVSTQHYTTTDTIDVSLDTVKQLQYPLKQRGYVKMHVGTAEVYGKIVFFDRNELTEGKDVLCQLRLDNPVVTKRGDRFILRRPSPAETIGGGSVIDASGEKYKFGEATIEKLSRKKEGTPEERFIDVLKQNKGMTEKEVLNELAIEQDEFYALNQKLTADETILFLDNFFLLSATYDEAMALIKEDLQSFHDHNPLREGKDLAQVKQDFSFYGKEVAAAIIQRAIKGDDLEKKGSFVLIPTFRPHYPSQWKKRMEQVETTIFQQGIEVETFSHIVEQAGIPEILIEELKHYFIRSGVCIHLDEKHLVSSQVLDKVMTTLKKDTENRFTLQDAKSSLGLSRKYLVPIMEKIDELGYTKRDGQERVWVRELE
ncbi:selenocysteine-specific translation elongation factor [Salipaludibacillus neizhouensis]|uniref:Selenocysteine-specific elongation factor n=1 Tax=Salipaludibacillus neizhouensis TaxID=885475 RepID=A0A3A9KAC4_9BACI|nr:selenocysteine-specific translation elongation factor [Salipaludibacillus neizhouensis]RKL69159.1 selenocysteine-specific translation elongation factor [Salipaludibacillus neizhouensis]